MATGLVALAASVLRAVYWFNPLLWIACRRLRHEAERACDDLVLASGISAPDYATHLLDVARESALRRHPWSPAIAIAHHSMLERRVRAMLNTRLNHQPLTAAHASHDTCRDRGGRRVRRRRDPFRKHRTNRCARRAAHPGRHPAGAPGRPAEAVERTARAQAATPAAQTRATGGTIEGVLYDQFGGSAAWRIGQADAGRERQFTELNSLIGADCLSSVTCRPATTRSSRELPGFLTVKNVVRAEPGATVRRHITLPIGTLEETILVTCGVAGLAPPRPSAPAGSATPGTAQQKAGPRGSEPKIPSTFTGGIGGQIKAPHKLSHTNPVCPTGVTPEPTVVRLAGRIGIDGLFTDLHDVSNVPAPYVASAMDASRQWVFTPTLLNGVPIEVNISVTVRYSWSN